MVNKANALNRIDEIKNYISNVKSTAYRGNLDQLEEQFENLKEMIERLEDIISSESEEFLNRPYSGL
jgi:chromosome segregation ATPase